MRFGFETPACRTILRLQRPWGEWVLRARPDADRGERHEIRLNGVLLMDDGDGRSEARLADVGLGLCEGRTGLHVLVGGLGFGFTAASVLRHRGVASVEVVEIEGQLAEFVLGTTASGERRFPQLDDPRLSVSVADVRERIATASSRWDCILLDVDNGPEALSSPRNAALYTEPGLRACRDALRRGGAIAIWSSEPSPPCLERMRRVFGAAEEIAVPVARDGRRTEYRVLAARRP